jgi:hypothetical protein
MQSDNVRKKMKLTAIMLTVATLTSVVFLAFALVQKTKAEEMEQLAKESHALALQEKEQCLLEVKLLQEAVTRRDSIITFLRAANNQ